MQHISGFQATPESLSRLMVEAATVPRDNCNHSGASSTSSTPSTTASAPRSCSNNVGTTLQKPKKKRLNHNELERKRRHHQREVLYELRDIIPTLHMVKPSTVLIMQKAKDYIDLLRRTIQEMEVEINDLRRALVAAGYPLPMPSHQQQVVCGFPGSQPASFNSSCQSPRLLPEQLLNVSQQLGMEQSLSFQGLGELGIGSAHFDPQEIENINRLHSVLSKGSMDMVSSSGRPLSPVSPYQLDQSHGCSSGEFKKQPHALHSSGSGVLGTHV